MDFSFVLNDYILDEKRLKAFGFKRKAGAFLLEKPIENGEFIAKISLNEHKFIVDLFDVGFNDVYEMVNISSLDGGFLAGLRQQIADLVEYIKTHCLINTNCTAVAINYIAQKYGAQPEYPWAEYPNFCTFKNAKQKWFALIMDIGADKLGLAGKHKINVINLKAEPGEIDALVDNKFVFPAYHMNKKHWITVLLSNNLPEKKLFALIDRSYELVTNKK